MLYFYKNNFMTLKIPRQLKISLKLFAGKVVLAFTLRRYDDL